MRVAHFLHGKEGAAAKCGRAGVCAQHGAVTYLARDRGQQARLVFHAICPEMSWPSTQSWWLCLMPRITLGGAQLLGIYKRDTPWSDEHNYKAAAAVANHVARALRANLEQSWNRLCTLRENVLLNRMKWSYKLHAYSLIMYTLSGFRARTIAAKRKGPIWASEHAAPYT